MIEGKINKASKIMFLISIALLPLHYWSFIIQQRTWHRHAPGSGKHFQTTATASTHANKLHRQSLPIPAAPTYRDTFVKAFESHKNLQISRENRPRPPKFREYEPLRYTDHKTLDYTITGLRNVTAWETATIFVDTHSAVTDSSKYEYVRILFYGIAAMSPQEFIGNSQGIWQAKFHIPDPGFYHVYVESVYHNKTSYFYRAITGSPFTVLVRPNGTSILSDAEVLSAMAIGTKGSSQLSPPDGESYIGFIDYPENLCTDAVSRPGRWVRCYNTPEPCVRTGWLWLPETCHYNIFTAQEIIDLPKPVWIVLAGSSVTRGTYFAFIDLLMRSGAKNLTDSPFWRCWGWMDLTLGNIRVSYLDFRTPYLFPSEINFKNPFVEREYFTNALWALHELGRMDGEGPDVFYLEETDPDIFMVHMVKTWLGADWNGRFMVHATKGCASLFVCGDRMSTSLMGKQINIWQKLEKRPHLNIEAVDENTMTIPLMHDQEQHMWKGVSQHFHRPCSDDGMYSCSVVCDMEAQQLLNAFLNSNREYTRKGTLPRENVDPSRPNFCLRCPKDLVPFTIKPHFEDLTCGDHIPLYQPPPDE